MIPPHCPNPACDHFHAKDGRFPFVRDGFYATAQNPKIQRFRCKGCSRIFSAQTFGINYYVKRTVDYQVIFDHLVTGSGLMDCARALKIRPETVQNRIERLARCAIAIHAELLNLSPMNEDLAADGFASFSFSQYHPNTVDQFIGCDSEFIYATGLSVLRRSGRMTDKQKHRRNELEKQGRADPGAVLKSFRALGIEIRELLSRKGVTGITLFTDEHKAYPRAFRRIEGFGDRICHVRISSRKSRTRDNPLFPVNYVDRQLRKDLSDHCRETVQFSRCPSAMMARMVLYRHFHNCVIHRRLREYRKGEWTTHAQMAGIEAEAVKRITDRYWQSRPFAGRLNLSEIEMKTWTCGWRNPGMEMGRYVPQFAAA